MVGIQWSETDDRTVFVVEALTLLVSLGKLQSLFTPDAFDPFVIDLPSFNAKEFCNLAISIATVLLGQSDQRQTQFLVIVFVHGFVLLTGTRNANDTTCSTFRSAKLLTGMDYSLTQPINRQALGFK
jgi:hypothetical protein